jgi:hypothetical protein
VNDRIEMVRIVPPQHRWLAVGVVAACVLGTGCTAGTACESERCGPAAADASTDASRSIPPGQDGGLARGDGGVGDAGPAPGGEFANDAANADVCWNGLDDDGNGIADCAERGCEGSAFCCLDRSTPACCDASEVVVDTTFATCVGTDPAACGTPAMSFGTPAPVLEGPSSMRALVPNGHALDSGLVYAPVLDGTREVLALEARIAAPAEGCTDCVDALAMALADPVPSELMHPDVAVLVRASRRDYALVVAGEVVATRSLTDDEPHLYVLRASPDGAVELRVDGGAPLTAEWLPQAGRRAYLYGRTQNRPSGAPPPARALTFRALRGGCEIPSALTHEGRPLLPDPSWGTLPTRAPSVLRDGDDVLLAFELGPNVHLARLAPDGTPTLGGSGDVNLPVLRAAPGETLRDPELVREEDRWAIYVTRVRGAARSLARAEGQAGFAEVFADPVDVVGGEGLSAPSVARFRGETLVAAVSADESSSSIWLFELVDGVLVPRGDLTEPVVRVQRTRIHPFDADEVGGPALYVDAAGILRLYYAGRRGTRWSIGMRASGDGQSWPYVGEEPVLEPADSGPSALGVLDPSVVVLDGRTHLFHTATDGASFRIARATGATRW